MTDHFADPSKKVRTAAEVLCCPDSCKKDVIPALLGKCHSHGFQIHAEALAAAGYMIVPREPSREQIIAALDRKQADEESIYVAIYRAMTSAGEVK